MLKDLRVLEFEGLAPTVFCGMYFADQGAEVILVARKDPAPMSMSINRNLMNRGKKWVVLSPKVKPDRAIIELLIKSSDIIIDPYRPGVLQKLGLGPEFIYKVNQKAILLRVSGYGQSGQMALRPGHDLNYISTSGIVPLINSNTKSQSQTQVSEFPTNYLADFVSCSLGITATLSALAISRITGKGRIVDCSMTDGCRYYAHIIDSVKNNKEVQILEPQFRNYDGVQFLILSKEKDEKQAQKVMEQMIKQGRQQFQTNKIRITRVNCIPELQTQVQGMKNPFDNNFNPKQKQLPSHILTSQQIIFLLKNSQMSRSKL